MEEAPSVSSADGIPVVASGWYTADPAKNLSRSQVGGTKYPVQYWEASVAVSYVKCFANCQATLGYHRG